MENRQDQNPLGRAEGRKAMDKLVSFSYVLFFLSSSFSLSKKGGKVCMKRVPESAHPSEFLRQIYPVVVQYCRILQREEHL